jgi:hypothetical protein
LIRTEQAAVMTDLDELWEALLSEDPARIRQVWGDVTDVEAQAIVAHLTRMRDDAGWSDGQRAAAAVALQVLHDQAQ